MKNFIWNLYKKLHDRFSKKDEPKKADHVLEVQSSKHIRR